LILKDLQEASFILPHEVSSREAFIFKGLRMQESKDSGIPSCPSEKMGLSVKS
jgi:hypothetical protein